MGNRQTEKFARRQTVFRCPLCGSGMKAEDASLRCEKGHCFDIAAKGYVNFVPQHGRSVYDAGLFQNRRSVFSQGFYDRVVQGLDELLEQHCKTPGQRFVFDAGCGEGFFAKALQSDKNVLFGADIEKQAVQMAAKGGNEVCWAVADLANLPFAKASMDVVLNILSPANYGEFWRVLKSGGVLVKILPGPEYLREIRELAGGVVAEKEENAVKEHFAQHAQIVGEREIKYRCTVDEKQAHEFLRMTPLTNNINLDELDAAQLREVTIDLVMLAGRERE